MGSSGGAASAGASPTLTGSSPSPQYGYFEKTYSLPGFDPMSGYLRNMGGADTQIPTLVSGPGQPVGIYYVDNASNFDLLYLENGSVHTIAPIVPLYQTYASYDSMLDNEFFLEYGSDEALFFGTITSGGSTYSIETVNVTTGASMIWNTSARVDGTNQQPDYVGNNTVIVMSQNCSIFAWNLASHTSWKAGTVGGNFSGSCFEANNVYWVPGTRQLINVEAQGSSGDQVEQLNATTNGKGQLYFRSVATIVVDKKVVFNWVNGIAYNPTTDELAFTAGYWVAGTVYTYVVPYSAKGLITATGLTRDTVYNSSASTPQMLNIQRYEYTADYMLGRVGGGPWTNGTQFLFDPWNGSTLQTNRSIDNAPCPNSCFEGTYSLNTSFVIDYNTTLKLNNPMYKVVYAYHDAADPYPQAHPTLSIAPTMGPNGTLVELSGVGYLPRTAYTYCFSPNRTACTAGSSLTTTSSGTIPSTTRLAVATSSSGYVVVSQSTFEIADANFTWLNATLSVSPGRGPIGLPVTLSGTRYAAGNTYTYCLTPTPQACSSGSHFTATSHGSIPASTVLTIPNGTTLGNYSIDVSRGSTYLDAFDGFVVDNNLTALLTATPPETDQGVAVEFNGTALGGQPPYQYFNWTLGDGTYQNSTNRSVSHTFLSVENYTVNLTVGDAGGNSTTVSWTEAVHAPPVAGTPSASRPTVDVGQSITFYANVTNGTAPEADFLWSGLPAGCPDTDQANVTCTAGASGLLTVQYNATDSVGDATGTSGSLNVTVFSDPTTTTPVANRTSVDVGQNVTFSTNASLGSGGYSYRWFGLPAGCASNVSAFACVPTGAEDAKIDVNVTDSNGFTITSGRLNFTVYADPMAPAPNATRTALDIGQSTTISESATPGSGALTYVWTGLPTGCTSTSSSFLCTPTGNGTFSVRVTVTDSNGVAATSPVRNVTVSVDPSVAAPVSNRSSSDVGQPVRFTVSATNGSGSLTYSWSGLPTGCVDLGDGQVDCTPTAPGSYSVQVSVTDSNGYSVTSATLNYTIDPDPTVGTPSPSPKSIDLGQGVNFSAAVTNGSGGITYRWTGLPTGCTGSGAAFTCTPSATGNFSVALQVEDSNGFVVQGPALAFRVFPDPVDSLPQVSPAAIDVGQIVTFTAEVTSGSGGYHYTWHGLPMGCSGTGASVACVPTTSGNFTIVLNATDANGYAVSSPPLLYRIYADPVATALATPATSADVEQNATFTAIVAQGLGPYQYNWSGLPDGCSGDTSVVVCGPLTLPGRFTVAVQVRDANGFVTESGALTFIVFADPYAYTPTANRTRLDVGQTLAFAVVASNGSGGLVYRWLGLPQGCSGNSSSLQCDPTVNGSFTVQVLVVDSNGFRATSPALEITVYADPTVGAPVAKSSAIDIGQPLTFEAQPSLGRGPYEYFWIGLPPGCTGTESVVTCVPMGTGTYPVSVRVTDANGFVVLSANATVSIAEKLSASLVAAPDALLVGSTGTFAVTSVGGTSPVSYAWLFGDGFRSTGAIVTHAFGSTGNYSVQVWVNDTAGVSVLEVFYVTVSPRPVTGLLGLPYSDWAIGAAAAVALVAIALLWRRRRTRSAVDTASEPSVENPEEGAAPEDFPTGPTFEAGSDGEGAAPDPDGLDAPRSDEA